MRKLLALLLAMIMVVGLMPVSVLAADTEPTISLTSDAGADLKIGDTFTVTAFLADNTGFGSLTLSLLWNSNVVKFTGFAKEWDEDAEDYKLMGSILGGTIVFNDESAKVTNARSNNSSKNGTIFVANFEVVGYGDSDIRFDTSSGSVFTFATAAKDDIPAADIDCNVDVSAVEDLMITEPSQGGDEPEVPANTAYQVYYEIAGTDSDSDKFVEINPGATFNVDVYVKSTDSSTKMMQAFDIYPTFDSMLTNVSVAVADAGEIVVTEMGANNPHFYSVAKDLNKEVTSEGVKVATMTLTLSEDAVYNTGYAVGLSDMTNLAVELDAESVPVTVDTTAKGAETLKTYTVAYDANEGTGAPEAQTKQHNVALTLSTTEPTRAGYEFAGWNTKADGTGDNYDAGASYTANANVTLYAQWTENTVEVTLNANGGKFGDEDSKMVSETFGESYAKTLAETPTREGYTFKGWFTASEGGEMITSASKVTNAVAHTVYAQWTPITYTVKFDMNGHGDAQNDVNATFDVMFALPTVSAEGWTFDGWKLGETTYTGGATVKNLTTEAGATVTLVAQWSQNAYTITIDENVVNGAVNAVKEGEGTSANMGDKIVVTVTPDAGYEVEEVFYTPENGTKTVINAVEGAYSFTMPAANVTVSATFKAIDYTVTVDDTTNGTVSSDKNTANVGETVTLTVTPNTGYELNELKVNSGAVAVTEGNDGKYTFTMPADNVIVTASFKGITTTVTLNANGGQFADGAATTIEVTYGEKYSALENVVEPTQNGYSFAGWYTEAEGGTKVEMTTDVTVYEASTLYAHWTAKTYTITFVTNGGAFAEGSGVADNKMTYTFGDNKTLPVVTKYLHTFKNWTVSYADSATEKGWGEAGATIDGGSSIINMYGDVTLTAKWDVSFAYAVESYKYAPEGYMMLRIATADNTDAYSFDGEAMYYTADENYKLDGNNVFVTLIPAEGNVDGTQLTEAGLNKIAKTGAAGEVINRNGKVNKDDVVNIADANAVYQMVVAGGKYYSMDQLGIKNRLEADVDTAAESGNLDAEFRGSIADVHAIVSIINDAASS